MRRNVLLFRGSALLLAVMMAIGTASCGTIIYPERRGQHAGRIDVGVAVLDGIGLLIFFVPGVIAFAVDFATGAIYLPRSSSSQLEIDPSNLQDATIIKTGSSKLTRSDIEMLVQENIRQEIDLASPQTRVARVVPSRPLTWRSITETLTPDQLAAFENN